MSPDQHTTTWTSTEVRRSFIDFFKAKAHDFVPSSPVVPHDDPTLLFTNAGMNQFKPIFLGQIPPGLGWESLRRAVNSQKCIRAGGKHNDLDDVGKDTYHHTFFEMLGNWSFGDYFKDETIAWAWQLLTEVYKLEPDRLYATYFGGDTSQGLAPDDEARELWLRFLPPERVLPFDMKDNFWEMGDTGPCGPCSEIHYDRIGGRDASSLVNMDDPDVIELWNLVFIQFDRIGPAELKPLPAKHVDTGMGLERLCSVLQGVTSNYDTDLFTPIFEAIQHQTNAPHAYTGKLGDADTNQIDMAYRVIADHIRTLAFAIADVAVPSNEGRGYVLRRVLRRGVRFGRQMLSGETGFFHKLVPTLVELMGEAYPELRTKQAHIMEVIADEEESFGRTLEKGIVHVNKEIAYQIAASRNPSREIFVTARLFPIVGLLVQLESDPAKRFISIESVTPEITRRIAHSASGSCTPTFSGTVAFELYDTYGFPLDLTELMAHERGLTVDVEGFNRCMAQQKERSRAAGKGSSDQRLVLTTEAVADLQHQGIDPTDDEHKYELRPISAKLEAIWNGTDFDLKAEGIARSTRPIGLVLSRTNCYAEAGGQVADCARIITLDADMKDSLDHLVVRGDVPGRGDGDTGEFRVLDVQRFGPYVLHIGHMVRGELRVDDVVELRLDRTRREHTAANHTATHLLNLALRNQLGDTVDQKGSVVDPDRLRFDFSAKPVADEQVGAIEQLVVDRIAQDQPVFTDTVPLAMARKINTLRAVFGEQYPDPVRVVSIGVPIDQLLKDPNRDAWMHHSVEFCGGTHLQRTGQAGAFAIVSETGIAKGIRRMEALTGVPAQAAIAAADSFKAQLDEAAGLDDAKLADALPPLQAELDTLTMPVSRRAALRAQLHTLTERVKAAHKRAAHEASARAIEQARTIADRARESGDRVIVAQLDAPAGAPPDRQALQAALKAIAQANPDAAVMLISSGQGQVALLAQVAKDLIDRGLKAGDWVRAAASACGGKGGGRPDQAQGGGTDPARIPDAIEAATELARSTLAATPS